MPYNEPPKALTPLKRCRGDRINIIAFDTEDNGSGAPDNFICACFYSEKEGRRHFTSRESARQYMFKKRSQRTVFVAHNLYYDLTNLDYPENTVELIPKKFGGIIGGLYKAGEKIKYRFIDTGNFFVGASLKQLGESLGVDGGAKLEFDVKQLRGRKFDQLPPKLQDEVLDYCMQDAKVCYLVAKKLVTLTNENNTRFASFTAASLALRIFRTNFMSDKYEARSRRVNDIERMAYYGGRTEVFDFRRHGNVKYEDIKSSYPTAMHNQLFPHPNRFSVLRNMPVSGIRDHEGISLVTVRVPKMHIPPLPYRQLHAGGVRLIFPTGTWTAAYCHPELRMAMAHGVEIVKVHESIIYHQMIRPFMAYVEDFYKKKETTKGIDREFYKLLLNGLSGKFGEKRNFTYRGKLDNINLEVLERMSGGIEEFSSPDSIGWINVTGRRLDDPKHAFPVWIAYVTAYGRIKLYEERLSKCDALYCDTDSCISENPPDISLGKSLGCWERETRKTFLAYAPKDYDTGDSRKMKGVPKRARQELRGGKLVWVYERPLKQSEAFRRHRNPNEWIEVEKENRYTLQKRTVLPDKTTEPFVIDDLPIISFDMLLEKYKEVLE